jgi:hypothetical protein
MKRSDILSKMGVVFRRFLADEPEHFVFDAERINLLNKDLLNMLEEAGMLPPTRPNINVFEEPKEMNGIVFHGQIESLNEWVPENDCE